MEINYEHKVKITLTPEQTEQIKSALTQVSVAGLFSAKHGYEASKGDWRLSLFGNSYSASITALPSHSIWVLDGMHRFRLSGTDTLQKVIEEIVEHS
ncbi:MAG: hypothetical protein E7423_02550 [Ruminococcaceae bacterium]|nr:hypothetical protein [Oscillospiraceae bacterium]